jgi:hypothetical protein
MPTGVDEITAIESFIRAAANYSAASAKETYLLPTSPN